MNDTEHGYQGLSGDIHSTKMRRNTWLNKGYRTFRAWMQENLLNSLTQFNGSCRTSDFLLKT